MPISRSLPLRRGGFEENLYLLSTPPDIGAEKEKDDDKEVELLAAWYRLLGEKNRLVRREQELMVESKPLELIELADRYLIASHFAKEATVFAVPGLSLLNSSK